MSSLLGGSSSPTSPESTATATSGSPSATPISSAAKAKPEAGAESYSLADPPGSKEDLLAMPKFFQGATMYWATARGAWKTFWLADVLGDQLGENARMVLVSWCLHDKNDLAYIACTGDAHRLDRKRLEAELEAPAARKYRQSALENFDELIGAVAKRDAEIAKREKEDPALKQVFHAIPTETWKQWDAFAATDSALLATARKLEIASQKRQAFDDHGPSRKAFAGCFDQLAPQFAKVVRATRIEKADSYVGTFNIATTPATYVTTLAMYYCARGNDLGIAGGLGSELTEREMLRGPRMATIEAVLAKSKSLKFDDKDYSIEHFVWRDANYINEDEQLYGETGGGHGLIKTVEHKGDALHITFVKEPFEYEECTKSVPSRNEWHYDRSTGNITAVEHCVQWVTKKDAQELEPIEIPASQGTAIQPGRFVAWQTTSKIHGVRAVWDSPKQKKLLAVYGVARS